jgi:hypothetical protein
MKRVKVTYQFCAYSLLWVFASVIVFRANHLIVQLLVSVLLGYLCSRITAKQIALNGLCHHSQERVTGYQLYRGWTVLETDDPAAYGHRYLVCLPTGSISCQTDDEAMAHIDNWVGKDCFREHKTQSEE